MRYSEVDLHWKQVHGKMTSEMTDHLLVILNWSALSVSSPAADVRDVKFLEDVITLTLIKDNKWYLLLFFVQVW